MKEGGALKRSRKMDFYTQQNDPVLNPPAVIQVLESVPYVSFKQKMVDRLVQNQDVYTGVARRIVNSNGHNLAAKDRMLRSKVKEVQHDYKEKIRSVKVKLSAPNLSANEVRRLKKKRCKLDKRFERDMLTLKDAFDLVTIHETSDFSDTNSVASEGSNFEIVQDPGLFAVLGEINNQ